MPLLRSLARPVLIASLTASFAAAPLFGQITNVTNDQSTPILGAGHDYIKLLNETVNPSNGSISLRIHVPVAPDRATFFPVGSFQGLD